MPLIVEFEQQGAFAVDNPPWDCDICIRKGGHRDEPGFRDVNDAFRFYQAARGQMIRQAWDTAWREFHCPPPGKDCKVKAPCDNKIGFLQARAYLEWRNNELTWRVGVFLTRKLKCVKVGPGTDIAPDTPAFQPHGGMTPLPNGKAYGGPAATHDEDSEGGDWDEDGHENPPDPAPWPHDPGDEEEPEKPGKQGKAGSKTGSKAKRR